jgi:cell division protein FtsB
VGSARLIRREGRPLSIRRVAAVAVLLLMAALYVSPVQKYLRASQRLHSDRAQVEALQRKHDKLTTEAASLNTQPTIVMLARACGFIYPGEHTFVIQDVPVADNVQCGGSGNGP